MFCRLEKIDGPIFGGRGEAYIWDVNWLTNLGCVYSGGDGGEGAYVRQATNGILRYMHNCITSMICR